MPHRRVVVLGIGFALAATAPARAAWSPPALIGPETADVDQLQAVSGLDGRVLGAWWWRHGELAGVTGASRSPTGTWGPAITFGTLHTRTGRTTGVGDGLLALNAFGRGRVVGLAVRPGRGRGAATDVWQGSTSSALRRRDTLAQDPWEPGVLAVEPTGAAAAAWTWMQPRKGAGSTLRPRVVMAARRSSSSQPFGAGRRISPLPPAPPYGSGLGPRLSATRATIGRRGRTVAVAWQRRGTIEARISQDGARSWGPVRWLGPSTEAFPGLAVRVAPDNRIVVAWSAREGRGAARRIVTRVARGPADGPLRTSVIGRSAPAAVPFGVADQFGPAVQIAFVRDVALVAFQDSDGTRVTLGTRRLDRAGRTTAIVPADGTAAVLDDLLVSPDAQPALAWHTATADSAALTGYVQLGTAAPEALAAGGRVADLRLVRSPTGPVALAEVHAATGTHVAAFTAR